MSFTCGRIQTGVFGALHNFPSVAPVPACFNWLRITSQNCFRLSRRQTGLLLRLDLFLLHDMREWTVCGRPLCRARPGSSCWPRRAWCWPTRRRARWRPACPCWTWPVCPSARWGTASSLWSSKRWGTHSPVKRGGREETCCLVASSAVMIHSVSGLLPTLQLYRCSHLTLREKANMFDG